MRERNGSTSNEAPTAARPEAPLPGRARRRLGSGAALAAALLLVVGLDVVGASVLVGSGPSGAPDSVAGPTRPTTPTSRPVPIEPAGLLPAAAPATTPSPQPAKPSAPSATPTYLLN